MPLGSNIDSYESGHGLTDKTAAIADASAPAALTQLAAPAGGSGATAGAYDTAANRNLAIASINAARDDVIALQAEVATLTTKLNSALAALRTDGALAS